MEYAHRELANASTSRAAATAAAASEPAGGGRQDGSVQPPPLAFEEFIEGLSEDFPPLSRDVLEACEGLATLGRGGGGSWGVEAYFFRCLPQSVGHSSGLPSGRSTANIVGWGEKNQWS